MTGLHRSPHKFKTIDTKKERQTTVPISEKMKFITSSLLTFLALLAAANAFTPHNNAAFMPRGPQMAQRQVRPAFLAALNMLDSSSSFVVADSALKLKDIVFPLAFYLFSIAFAVKNPEPRVDINYSATTSKLKGNAFMQASSVAVVVGEEAEAPKPKPVAKKLTMTPEVRALENSKLLSLAATYERQAQIYKYGAPVQKEKKSSLAFMAIKLLFRGFGRVFSPFKRIFSS
jgi:hypothetical protein